MAWIDRVDAEFHGGHDRALVGDVGADPDAALVRRVDGGGQFVGADFQQFRIALHRVASGGEDLDVFRAALDLLAHAAAEAVGAVAFGDAGVLAALPVPGEGAVLRVGGGGDVAAADHDPGARDQPLVDRLAQGGVDGVRGAGADHAGEAAVERQRDIVGAAEGEIARRALHADRQARGADVAVAGVIVAVEHARHHRAALAVDHLPVVGGMGEGGGRHLGDAIAVDHEGGALGARAVAVHHGDVGDFNDRHPILPDYRPASRRGFSRSRSPSGCQFRRVDAIAAAAEARALGRISDGKTPGGASRPTRNAAPGRSRRRLGG
jgi:hypothetical protein